MRENLLEQIFSPITRRVIRDAVPAFIQGYCLTGSGAYQLQLPNMPKHSINDVDFVVYPLNDDPNLIGANITDKFYITRAAKTSRGLQMSLVHKASGCWVDIFPRDKVPRYIEQTTEFGEMKLHQVEEIAYGLCVSILERTQQKRVVLSDSIEKLKRLTPYLDLDLFDQIADENAEQANLVGATFGQFTTGKDMLSYVVRHAKSFTPPGYRFEDYPRITDRTQNGLGIESADNYSRAMSIHNQYIQSLGNQQ